MLSKKTRESTAGEGRRSFLAKLGVGIAAITAVSAGLVRPGLKQPDTTVEFPGPDSIFHPAQDPRHDPRRQN